jgi:hypothetical protein
MTDSKMLQAILDGQKSLKEDIRRVEKKVEENGSRIDMLGKQLAVLDDDAPSGEEFKALEKRVKKLETKSASLSS